MGLWGESVQGKGSEWRSASRRRPLQTRTTHHGNIPKTPPLSPEPQTCANWGQFFFQWVAVVPSLQSPPPPGGETVISLFCYAISIAGICSPLSHIRSCIAFPLLPISHLRVFCDILSPKAVYRVYKSKASPQTGWSGCATGR